MHRKPKNLHNCRPDLQAASFHVLDLNTVKMIDINSKSLSFDNRLTLCKSISQAQHPKIRELAFFLFDIIIKCKFLLVVEQRQFQTTF